jgi:hypothetical protein
MSLRLRGTRNFRLFVDSGRADEPADRWFQSLDAALRAFRALDAEWRRFAWIIEYQDQETIGGIPLVRNVVHVRGGQQTHEAPR